MAKQVAFPVEQIGVVLKKTAERLPVGAELQLMRGVCLRQPVDGLALDLAPKTPKIVEAVVFLEDDDDLVVVAQAPSPRLEPRKARESEQGEADQLSARVHVLRLGFGFEIDARVGGDTATPL